MDTLKTENGEFKVGERVIYSDLSAWEVATIVAFNPQGDVTMWFEGDLPSEPLSGCMPDGLRKHTPENVAEFIG